MITAEQREARRACIGSSDAPVLTGSDQYRSLFDLWLDKTGRLEDRPASDDADRGTDLEPYVLDMFERRMGVRLARNIELRNGGIFAANLDAAITSPGAHQQPIKAGVEAKTTVDDEAWGEAIDDVPERVLVQVQAQMMVGGYDITYVPVLIPKFKRFHFEIYQVMRHDELIAQIKERGEWFWSECVQKDTPPPNVLPTLGALKRRRREPKSVVCLTDEARTVWEGLENLKLSKKNAEQAIEKWQCKLLSMLGDAEAGEFESGEMLTYLAQKGARRIDIDLLQMRLRERGCEDILEGIVEQPEFRVLRFKKSGKK